MEEEEKVKIKMEEEKRGDIPADGFRSLARMKPANAPARVGREEDMSEESESSHLLTPIGRGGTRPQA